MKYGAGGIATRGGRFIVVGGLPNDINENYLYEYDSECRFVKQHALASGHTHLGIQGASYNGRGTAMNLAVGETSIRKGT